MKKAELIAGIVLVILSSIPIAGKKLFLSIPFGPIVSSVMVLASCIIGITLIVVGVKGEEEQQK